MIGIFVGVTQIGGKMNIVLETSKGNIEIELFQDKVPKTVENFLSYVNDGSYEGTIFHRVIKGFMIQGGGFTPDGNQKATKAPIPLEANLPNEEGTIAMARTSDPNSATSQFFINTANNQMLNPAPGNPGYTVFGKVIKGMDVVKQIENVQTGQRPPHADWPVEDITINKAYVK
ncbi:MAG: peptidylprolyl isomerase [Candidatus Nanoarchaeia archaeon]